MNYILDTNILLLLIRNSSPIQILLSKFDIFGGSNYTFVSAVSIGEIRSLALQNNWGAIRKERTEKLIKLLAPIAIEKDVLFNAYAEIDAFSQGKHPTIPLPKGMSARNMGKNDLWIAATAKMLQATLITTDNDFNHLLGTIIQLETVAL